MKYIVYVVIVVVVGFAGWASYDYAENQNFTAVSKKGASGGMSKHHSMGVGNGLMVDSARGK
ncbi:MAG: hypothetical protein OEX00_12240 [Gammaproteobacteria bacterium]|nr:hypothetical protein [Gammaproteobacteria bacterium]MDH5691740.1 hypothetical protein [Gammaproteobacteria bacterium]